MPKLTTRKDDSFVEYVCDQLDAFEIITYKAMFGGYGLYCGDVFFGIVFDGKLYFKTDEHTCERYLDWEMEPFQPNAKQTLKSYYQVPVDFVDDTETLCPLAEEAVTVAHAAKG
ncbi:MAG: hypothetical protein COA73_01065 [Candidatus Hydrogenedentota bacterium]|nr:MAG: hypothetical protein COA73_01065 [Candidatus Hydrogenedentota bacterium]